MGEDTIASRDDPRSYLGDWSCCMNSVPCTNRPITFNTWWSLNKYLSSVSILEHFTEKKDEKHQLLWNQWCLYIQGKPCWGKHFHFRFNQRRVFIRSFEEVVKTVYRFQKKWLIWGKKNLLFRFKSYSCFFLLESYICIQFASYLTFQIR